MAVDDRRGCVVHTVQGQLARYRQKTVAGKEKKKTIKKLFIFFSRTKEGSSSGGGETIVNKTHRSRIIIDNCEVRCGVTLLYFYLLNHFVSRCCPDVI